MSQEESIGYGQPPRSTRFRKGQSGNPRGRPKNRHRDIPYDAVLGQMVTMRENGKERRVTAAEAFLLQLTQKGLTGDRSAARDALEAIEAARSARGESEQKIHTLVLRVVDSGVDVIIEPLGIAVLKYPSDETRARFELNPWIVEAALTRLNDRRLTIEEQREVYANTRTPHKVNWPKWWEVKE